MGNFMLVPEGGILHQADADQGLLSHWYSALDVVHTMPF